MINAGTMRLVSGFLLSVFIYTLSVASENENIKNRVIDYINTLAKISSAERKEDFDKLKKKMLTIADENIAKKLFLWVHSWHDSNLFMKASLKKIDFKKMNITGDKATTETEEIWIYRYINNKSGRVVFPDTKIYYRVLYQLNKKKGKWIITDVKVLKEKKEKLGNQEGKKWEK